MELAKIQNLKNQAISAILEAQSEKELEELRISFLGRRGEITQILKTLPGFKKSERAEYGHLINDAKNAITLAIETQKKFLTKKQEKPLKRLDVTRPGKKPAVGHCHLITQAIEEIVSIFTKIGFYRVRYPEVEWDWFAFKGLNFPQNHPARDEWETFFIENLANKKYGAGLLTPHTSSGQLREMARKKPPLRMLNIAKCYRRQADVSHAQMFHQFEGLLVDEKVSIAHLKGTLDFFVKQYFGKERRARIRPYHFQFTEPSFEVDVSCAVCGGKGCPLCQDGWLELGGSGMVHPQVLENGGLDPKKYSGFAFGWGVERVLLMKSGLKIHDLRLFYENDLRFLEQF